MLVLVLPLVLLLLLVVNRSGCYFKFENKSYWSWHSDIFYPKVIACSAPMLDLFEQFCVIESASPDASSGS